MLARINIEIWIAIIIPTGIFVLGIVANWIMTSCKKRRELKLYKELIVSWVSLSTKQTVSKYIDHLRDFAKEVVENTSMNVPIYNRRLMSFDRLNSLPIEKIADTILINLKTNSSDNEAAVKMYNYVASIEFLVEAESLVNRQYEEYRSMSKQLIDEWVEIYTALRAALLSRETRDSTPQVERDFYRQLCGMIEIVRSSKRNAKGEISMHTWDQIFLSPAMNMIENIKTDTNSSELFFDISDRISKLDITYGKWSANTTYGFWFSGMCDNIITAQNSLFKTVEYIKTHRLKRWWSIK